MSEIRTLKLDLLRHGRAHNHLLSPLTPYLAICGSEGPVTVQIPWEHRQLLNRLQRLRYSIEGKDIAAAQREFEVRDMGEALGGVLAQVPALSSQLGNARARAELIHFRLSVSAFELGMVPFELTISPSGFPGAGSPLFLQSELPIALTREIRHGQPLAVNWNRKPKILFAFATPEGFAAVPAQDHMQALRRAIEPWVKRADSPEESALNAKDVIRVLPDATLDDIRKICATNEFTHVHILAHGATFEQAGDRRYGMALLKDARSRTADIVDGERLVLALTARDSSGAARPAPTLVSLATCDSGNINSVLTPGGSIAHELQANGIPWVIASQFPLWMHASTIAAEVLFGGLLKGDDPRWVLFTLRQRLRTDSAGTHDWASLVAYATVPWNFDVQVNAFRTEQTRRKNNLRFDRIDVLISLNQDAPVQRRPRDTDNAELETLCKAIREDLAVWRSEPVAVASGHEKAERLGVSGASEKRIAIAYEKAGNLELSRKAYEAALEFYRSALEAEPHNHWCITQYLATLVVPALADDAAVPGLAAQFYKWWLAARQIAEWQLRTAAGVDRAWALGTLAELTLLGAVYDPAHFDAAKARERIAELCLEIRPAAGSNPFPVFSTRRQFMRYLDCWSRVEWNELATISVAALTKPTAEGAASGRT